MIFYADASTDSMRRAIGESEHRRRAQEVYNREHGVEPRSILKDIGSPLVQMSNLDLYAERIARLEKEMKAAAKALEFEQAAALRDKLKELRELQIYAG